MPAGVTLSPRWVQQSSSTALVSLEVGLRAHRAGRQGGEVLSMDGTLTCRCSPTGLKTNARAVPKGSFQNTEEKYENIGIKRQQTEPRLEPNLEPKDEAQDNPILYASLTLSNSSSPAAPPHLRPKEVPQEETLYSLIKA
ncbi:paired immunoglobulin-like type 2 receptor alpha [Lontra canadensis]|uniref:paired immunoglobulin-like type 2 receptor alpha n=1 Tax=Lontra canadensis TaxID=76717 RepID=UPI0013F32820|nr:paired immunoglobulin-like type 2 receptor alpha [Lontra canadensis]